MSRRIEIELTSARPDGTWTWRAAGALKPKGVLDGALLPSGATVGSVYRADTDSEIDGITVLAVTDPKGPSARGNVLEILGSDRLETASCEVAHQRDVEDPDGPGLDQGHQMGQRLTGHLPPGVLDNEVVDGAEFDIVGGRLAHGDPPVVGVTAS